MPKGAIGIAGGKVAWIGPDAEAPASGAAKVWDLGGKVVTPGLVDPHTHIVYGEEGLIDFEVLTPEAANAGISSRAAAASAPW